MCALVFDLRRLFTVRTKQPKPPTFSTAGELRIQQHRSMIAIFVYRRHCRRASAQPVYIIQAYNSLSLEISETRAVTVCVSSRMNKNKRWKTSDYMLGRYYEGSYQSQTEYIISTYSYIYVYYFISPFDVEYLLVR